MTAAERYWLLVEAGDELLDYREAVERYMPAAGRPSCRAATTVSAISDFIPQIIEFCRVIIGPMFYFFEEDGGFKTGTILDRQRSLQVETASRKRARSRQPAFIAVQETGRGRAARCSGNHWPKGIEGRIPVGVQAMAGFLFWILPATTTATTLGGRGDPCDPAFAPHAAPIYFIAGTGALPRKPLPTFWLPLYAGLFEKKRQQALRQAHGRIAGDQERCRRNFLPPCCANCSA